MSLDHNLANKARNALVHLGYRDIQIEASPDGFSLNPDIYGEDRKRAVALYFRKREEIPEFLLQRMVLVKSSKEELDIYVIFPKKPGKMAVSRVSLYGIGVAHFRGAVLTVIRKSRNFAEKTLPLKTEIAKPKGRMHIINLFPSSPQKAQERKTILSIVEEIRNTHEVPIFPKPVEKDRRFTIEELRENVNELLSVSDIFFGVLKDEFREIVDYEVRKSFDHIRRDRMIILVETVSRKKRDDRQNKLIDWLKKQRFKYLPYTGQKDFEYTARREIYRDVKSIYRKGGVEPPF